MKKILSIISSLAILFSVSTLVVAAPAPKTVPVALSAASSTLEVGQTTTLTASVVKQGSSYTDSWTGTGVLKNSTVLDEATGCYVSTATFTAVEPGTYTITYAISMSAGKSAVVFNGTQSVTITVVAPAKIVGATIKNVDVTAKYNKQGNLTGYAATGDVYALWNNGNETYYGETSFNFSSNQEKRNLDALVEGTTYTVFDIVNPALN